MNKILTKKKKQRWLPQVLCSPYYQLVSCETAKQSDNSINRVILITFKSYSIEKVN